MPDVHLTPRGRADAARLAAAFEAHAIAAVYASPVQRAVETAAPIHQALGLPLLVEAGFEEIDFGIWTGQSFAALANDPDWHAWNRLRSLATCPGGESMHHAQSRALAALQRIRLRYSGQVVVVVSHADIIKALLAPALGLSLDRLHRLTIDPASVSTLVLFDDDLRIDRINANPPD